MLGWHSHLATVSGCWHEFLNSFEKFWCVLGWLSRREKFYSVNVGVSRGRHSHIFKHLACATRGTHICFRVLVDVPFSALVALGWRGQMISGNAIHEILFSRILLSCVSRGMFILNIGGYAGHACPRTVAPHSGCKGFASTGQLQAMWLWIAALNRCRNMAPRISDCSKHGAPHLAWGKKPTTELQGLGARSPWGLGQPRLVWVPLPPVPMETAPSSSSSLAPFGPLHTGTRGLSPSSFIDGYALHWASLGPWRLDAFPPLSISLPSFELVSEGFV